MKKLLLLLSFYSLVFSESYKSQTIGVELNPLRPFFSVMTNGLTFSGSLNIFNYDNAVEISFPLTYNQHSVTRYEDYEDTTHSYDEVDLNAGIHARKYLSAGIKGFYLGVFGRYTYLEGKLKDDYRLANVHKFGAGGEFGFRIMRHRGSRIYWGMSLGVGRYFGENNNVFEHNYPAMMIDDREYFIDIEALKFGYEF
ncbi:MAG: hypothetical protein U9O86_09615 [Campylobacterota bacterium]|nr:hypothetical protein [Campylobacterota bacterium]